jgi:hypothetical protein
MPLPKGKVFRPRGTEKDGLKYYQEQDKHGDYVSVDPSPNACYGHFEARCTAIAGDVTSVCTVGVSRQWLQKHCHRVRKADIPKQWLEVL